MSSPIISKNKLLKSLYLILFLCLFIVAIYFSSGVIEQFASRKSSFSQYFEPIEERPTIIICPENEISSGISLSRNFWYGQDFQMVYTDITNLNCRDVEFPLETLLDERTDYLKEGINNISLKNGDIEMIKLEYFPYSSKTKQSLLSKVVTGKNKKILNPVIDEVTGFCYKLTPMSPIKDTNQRCILMTFKNVLITKYKAQFYFTSEANSYGLINNEWMEGNVMAVALDGNKNSKKIKLIPERHTFLQPKSKCSEKGSYYECLGNKLAEEDFRIKGVLKEEKVWKCPRACSVYSFPNLDTNKIPRCNMYHSDEVIQNTTAIEPEEKETKVDQNANKNKAFLFKKDSGIFKKNQIDSTKENEIDNAEDLESNETSKKEFLNLLQGSKTSKNQSNDIDDEEKNTITNNIENIDSNEKSEKKNIFNIFKKGKNDTEQNDIDLENDNTNAEQNEQKSENNIFNKSKKDSKQNDISEAPSSDNDDVITPDSIEDPETNKKEKKSLLNIFKKNESNAKSNDSSDDSKNINKKRLLTLSDEALCSTYFTIWNFLEATENLRNCSISCSINKYEGNVITEENVLLPAMRLVYGFETPKQTKVFEEYIIMDGMSMIGVVGGTFGLFIGFSFIGIIEYIFSLFRKSYKVC